MKTARVDMMQHPLERQGFVGVGPDKFFRAAHHPGLEVRAGLHRVADDVVGKMLGKHGEQLDHRIKSGRRNHRRLKIGPPRQLFPLPVPEAPDFFHHRLEILPGRLLAEDLPAQEGGHVTPGDDHGDRDIGQASKTIDLLRNKFGGGAFLDAALGFQAGRAASRRA